MKRFLSILFLPLCILLLTPPNAAAGKRKLAKKALQTAEFSSKKAAKKAAANAQSSLTNYLRKQILAQELRHNNILPKQVRSQATSLNLAAIKFSLRRAKLGMDKEAATTLTNLQRKKSYYPKHLFIPFITKYYSDRFGQITPKMLALLRNLETLHQPVKETQLLNRMTYLSVHANDYLAFSPYISSIHNVRLHYMGSRSAKDLNAQSLFYEYELRIEPGKPFPSKHKQTMQFFQSSSGKTPIAGWRPAPQDVAEFYSQLLQLSKNEKPIILLHKKDKKLIISNQTQTRWIRITSHELANPQGLHIHLCWLHRTATPSLQPQPVLMNISLPLTRPVSISDTELYSLLVEGPVQTLVKAYKVKPGSAADF